MRTMMKMKSVAPRLMMMMMMMMVACVSAGPLPPLFRSDYSNATNVPQQKQGNVTGSDYSNATNVPQQKQGNVTRQDDLQFNKNITGRRNLSYDLKLTFASICFLPSCALANLGHSLQTGDETAGSFTRDPFSYGKK
ncbi:uncharacterized protein zgc:193726 isoform X2 [Solea solea]|uniref:uncharacterized protein zgc:193726 isoform X2 n=1 Tax=Solea solea TaxID=90069 RepID=UPI00272DBBD0|nr:uncharacterized protein zgc:193726 isoform X2 [Solea solea]